MVGEVWMGVRVVHEQGGRGGSLGGSCGGSSYVGSSSVGCDVRDGLGCKPGARGEETGARGAASLSEAVRITGR